MRTLIVILSAVVLAGCSREPSRTVEAGTTAPVAVRATTVTRDNWPASYEVSGTVKARTAATLASKVMSYVRDVRVHAGERVSAGQVLVVLDARDLEAGYRQAEAARNEARSAVPEVDNAVASASAQLELAKVTFGRMKDLFDKRSISNQEFDESAAKLKLAQAGYDMAAARRTQLNSKIAQADEGLESAAITRSYAQIQAPFAGVVTERTAEPGNLAAPGTPLLTVEREGAYRLEAAIEESKGALVHLGQPVTVVLDSFDQPLAARVSEIVPAVDPAARSFVVKIDLAPNPRLRSGLFGRAQFAFGSRDVLAVPAAAVTANGQLTSVLVADGGHARLRLVTLGQRSGDHVEVLSGLNAGDRVIVPVPAGLSDGAAVEVRP